MARSATNIETSTIRVVEATVALTPSSVGERKKSMEEVGSRNRLTLAHKRRWMGICFSFVSGGRKVYLSYTHDINL